jgi:hexosaminidase
MSSCESVRRPVAVCILIFAVCCSAACGDDDGGGTAEPVDLAALALVPEPASLAPGSGFFELRRRTSIIAGVGARAEAEKLAAMLRPATGLALEVRDATSDTVADANIDFRLVADAGGIGTEGYRLQVTTSEIRIRATAPAGLYYAAQTLRQLLPQEIFRDSVVEGVAWRVPSVAIEDRPDFEWRGAMLDVGRHFMPAGFVRKFIDLLALHKLNRFHWHLTEDQGWRIEIEKYPLLTEIGAFRSESPVRPHPELGLLNSLVTAVLEREGNAPSFDGVPHGGFYTQAEIREIVAYAAERHIVVIPEIDMPGHTRAAVASYPEIGNTGVPIEVATTYGIHQDILNVEESTFEFLEDVLDEVMDLFPGPYVHTGGDEAPRTQWENSPEARDRIAELGLSNVDDLQNYFTDRMAGFVRDSGRRMMGWNCLFHDDLPSDVIIVSWVGQNPGIVAAEAGHDVVMADFTTIYFDYPEALSSQAEALLQTVVPGFNPSGALNPLEDVYAFDPIPAGLSEAAAAHILGAQGQLWTEWINDGSEAESRAFPRLSALAEVLWTPAASRDYGDFQRRLDRRHLGRLDELDVDYFPTP